jgi:hypothetical protein
LDSEIRRRIMPTLPTQAGSPLRLYAGRKIAWYKERHLVPTTPEFKNECQKAIIKLNDMLNSVMYATDSLTKRARIELGKCRDIIVQSCGVAKVPVRIMQLVKEINLG